MSIRNRAEGQAGAELGARTPIGASRILTQLNFLFSLASAKSSAFVFISNHIIPKEKVKVVYLLFVNQGTILNVSHTNT